MNTASKLWIGLGTLGTLLLVCVAIRNGDPLTTAHYALNWLLLLSGVLVAGLTGAAVLRDIAQSERALRDNRDLLRLTLASIGDAVIATDVQGRITFLNALAEALTGWSQAQAVGANLEQVFRIQDAATEEPIENPALRAVREGRVAGLANQTVVVSKTGQRWPIDFSATTIRDGYGHISGVVVIFRDVSARRAMEKHAELERAQAESAQRELAAQLAESERRKHEFLAMLAHELRNPLAPIRHAVQLLQLTAAEHPGVQSTAGMLERQVAQMVRLVDDLLDVSRISRGKIELRLERTELSLCVQPALESVRGLLSHMNHELLVNLPAEPIYVRADAARLTQIIGNLLNNACKFTDPGGCIELSVALESGYALICVRDNGIGIAPEHLPSIFEMFRQLDDSLERAASGLGIGLTLVKSLVEMHQGSITARSAGVGRGAEFEARLPLWPEAATQAEAANSSAAQQMPAQRVLVVDDNRDAAASLAMLLKLSGHEAFLAHDGLEAFAQAQALQPQIILLDIGLPKLNGFEVARKIRGQPWGAKIILIALTGWGTAADRQKSRDSGFDEHLVKPVDYPTLTRRLQELYAQRATISPHV